MTRTKYLYKKTPTQPPPSPPSPPPSPPHPPTPHRNLSNRDSEYRLSFILPPTTIKHKAQSTGYSRNTWQTTHNSECPLTVDTHSTCGPKCWQKTYDVSEGDFSQNNKRLLNWQLKFMHKGWLFLETNWQQEKRATAESINQNFYN